MTKIHGQQCFVSRSLEEAREGFWPFGAGDFVITGKRKGSFGRGVNARSVRDTGRCQ